MKNLRILIFVLTLPLVAFSQMTEVEVREMAMNADEQELVIQSSSMIQNNYYFHAEILVDRLLIMNPTSPNYNYRKGFLVLSSRQDYIEAQPYLETAITNTDKNYDAYSAKELSSPLESYYHLGQCYHLNEELDKARENYNKFLLNSQKNSPIIDLATLKLTQCDVAEALIAKPKTAEVHNIGAKVNGETPEYAPVVSLDGTSLYFTSRRGWDDKSSDQYKDPMLNNFPEDIFVSYQDFEGEWTSPEKLAFCDNRLNEATIAVSSDERKIYVYQDATGGGDIYYSEFGDNKFEDLKELDYKAVNTEYWETHCTVTPDGENMYFVSDRPGGFGGRDIWRIVKLPNGEWSEAQNMGPEINTIYDEDSPFIAVNNKTLYYSSNGPSSMGGFDVFVTFRDENNQWAPPVNMGYPINSAGDDIFYTTTIDGLRGYLSSFRKGGYGEKDIYEIRNDYLGTRPISTLKGLIASQSGDPIPTNFHVTLECLNCDKDDNKITTPRIKNGAFFSVLERCKEYVITYYEGEKVIAKKDFETRCDNQNEEINGDHMLDKYTLAGTVSDRDTKALLANSHIQIINPKDGSIIEKLTTDAEGAFVSTYLDGKTFGTKIRFDIKVANSQYFSETFEVDTILGENTHIQLAYVLRKIGINPILFDLDKANIRADAAIELDKIVKIMNENPEIVIELAAHTDCRASSSYNMSLSSRRAKSSAAYIQKRIDNPDRIYGKGYGETQLVNDCECEGDIVSDCSDEEHQANRRTEFKIVTKK